MKTAKYVIVTGALALAGCQSTKSDKEKEIASLEAALEVRDRSINELNEESQQKKMKIAQLKKQISGADVSGEYPDNARDGQCFAKVMTPPRYASKKVRVKVRDESTTLKLIPAKYRWVEKKIEVVPASVRVVKVPAKFATKREKVLVEKEHSVWKKNKDASGNISMCKVKVPAKYRVVNRTVETSPASTREVSTAAKYKTVRVKELVREESHVSNVIPASYKTVNQRILVDGGTVSWSEVVCNENAPRASIAKIQRSLKARGYNPGRVDGVIGSDTLAAVDRYQQRKKLARGALTKETVNSLLKAH